MAIEIERKFLVDDVPAAWEPPATATAAWVIRQGYVTPPGTDPEVRVRHAEPVEPASVLEDPPRPAPDAAGGVVRQLTTKAAVRSADGGAVARHEVEVDVDEAQFDELWAITEGRRIEKVRVEYLLEAPGAPPRVFTVDRFRGVLSGLVLAEVEFEDDAAARGFAVPAFLRAEVSDDRRYRNSALAAEAAPPEEAGPGAGA